MACCGSPKGRARPETAWEGSAKVLHTGDPSPTEKVSFRRQRRTARIAKATYGANDPSEDRHTVAVGTECLFAGVWDGHGGEDLCAEYLDRELFTTFRAELNSSGDPSAAFSATFSQVDQRFIGDAEKEGNLKRMCCGACALGAFVQILGDDVVVTVGNAGDCRAVCGIFQGTELQTKVLSSDHSIAASPSERERLRTDFPHHEVIKFDSDEGSCTNDPEEGTVLGLCRFTRALGDGHLKSPAAAEAFNKHHIRKGTGLSIPVMQSGDLPYISCVPECTAARFTDGFVILACDGVWDEISNEQAVRTVGKLLYEHGEDPSVNIAELFITQVLKNAAARIADEVEGEAEMTYRELRRRPCGKAPGARSSLHDDITVVILDFEPPEVEAAASGGIASARQQTLAALTPSRSPTSSPDSPSSADGSPGSKGPKVISVPVGRAPLYRADSTDMGVPDRLSPRSGPRKTRPAGVRIRPRSSSDRLEAMMRSSVDGLPPLE